MIWKVTRGAARAARAPARERARAARSAAVRRVGPRGAVAALLAAAVFAAPGATARQQRAPEQLPLDRAVDLGVAPAPLVPGLVAGRALRFVPSEDGPFTLTVESAEGDVLAAEVGPDGAPVGQDDDGLVGWNARLVLAGRKGQPLDLVVGFKDRTEGTLTVRMRSGDVPAPDGPERVLAEAEFHRARGASRRARGEAFAAAVDFHEAGSREAGLGRLAQSRQDYTEVLELAEQVGHPMLRTVALARIGEAEVQFGEFDLAVGHLSAAVAEARELPHQGLEAFALSNLAVVHFERGEASDARADLERCLELARAAGDVANEIGFLGQMGDTEWLVGDRAAAVEWHAQAIELARGRGTADVLGTALLAAGRFHGRLGEIGLARTLLEEAADLPLSAQKLAAVRGELANVLIQGGNEVAARDLYGQVLVAARELGDAGLEASALFSLGSVAWRLGDFGEARRRLSGALELLGPGGPLVRRSECLRTLANVEMDDGNPDVARPLLDESLALARQAADRPREALVLSTLVAWDYHRGNYEAARATAQRQLALARDLSLPALEAASLASLAELSLRLGDLAGARRTIDEALARQRVLADPRLLQWGLLTAVEVALREGDAARMAAIVSEAEALFERSDAGRLDPEQAALLRAQDVFSLWGEWSQELVVAQLAAKPPDAAAAAAIEEGFRRAGLWKGRSLLQGIAEHRSGARSATITGLRRSRREALTEGETLLARVSVLQRSAGADPDQLAALRSRAEDRLREAAGLLEQLRAAAPQEAALDMPAGLGSAELSAVLGPEQVLIEFADGQEHLGAYRLAGGQLTYQVLGERAGIESDVAAFLAGLSRPEALAPPDEVARRGRALYDRLLAPLLPDSSGGAPLVIVPTSALAALPFEALVVEAEGRPARFDQLVFVIDRHEVTYAPSSPVLALLAQAGPRAAPGPMLLLADPVYASETRGEPSTVRGGAPRPDWPRLPGTRDEAVAVLTALLVGGRDGAAPDPQGARILADLSARFAQERSLAAEAPGVALRLGAQATPACLPEDLRRYAVLHCASHGWVDPTDPRNSGLVLSAGPEGDGMLRAAEILELDLDADLAVLSACETGAGAIRRGEGVQSLARAFLYAGARNVVASLWQVDDFETQQIMSRFYAGCLAQGEPGAAALREARLGVRRAKGGRGFAGTGRGGRISGANIGAAPVTRAGHPYFWAPFVSIGLPGATVRVAPAAR